MRFRSSGACEARSSVKALHDCRARRVRAEQSQRRAAEHASARLQWSDNFERVPERS
jgi:hypothetical protein